MGKGDDQYDDVEEDFVEDDDEEKTIEFPMLYHEVKKRKWMVQVIGDTIHRNDGLSNKDFVKKPNIRKVDAKKNTTSHEQALLDARKYWVKKLDEGYRPLDDDEDGQKMYEDVMSIKKRQGGNNHGIGKKSKISKIETSPQSEPSNFSTLDEGSLNHFPMLAMKYSERESKVIWDIDKKKDIVKKVGQERFDREYFDATAGCFVNPKLDGLHCIAFVNGENVILSSRQGKQFVFLNHIRDSVNRFLKGKGNICLVGELYVHSPVIKGHTLKANERFSFISSACKTNRNKPHEDEAQIQYHIFDMYDRDRPQLQQMERLKVITSLFSRFKEKSKTLIPVKVTTINSSKEIMQQMANFLDEDYEGIILRNPSGVYEAKRSIHLLKHKEFDDDEFIIVGAKPAKGTAEGAVIWELETRDGSSTFSCNMTGDLQVRIDMYENYTDYLGKKLNVKYQGLSKDGIPRFPRGIYIRDEDV